VPEWLLLVIAAGVIGARLYLRVSIQRKSLTASDILVCFAWISAAASAAFDIKFAIMGILDVENDQNFTPDDLEYILMVSIATRADCRAQADWSCLVVLGNLLPVLHGILPVQGNSPGLLCASLPAIHAETENRLVGGVYLHWHGLHRLHRLELVVV
jgi:hypothetical protein